MSKRRRNKPMDPAEITRRKAEREKHTRRTPSEWGVNEGAMSLPQNSDVQITSATREKTARVQRFDCFITLGITVDQHQAVRRYQDELAIRYGCEGSTRLVEFVDGGGSAELVTQRSLDAAGRLDELAGLVSEPWMMSLIEALSLPSVVKAERVNWKAVVRTRTGLIDRDAQARAVKVAVEGVRRAWSDFDNRRMKKAA